MISGSIASIWKIRFGKEFTMNIFVIPDVHLKPRMFQKADELLKDRPADAVVMLGDIPDDWGCEHNIGLYTDTYLAAEKFCKEHQETYFCLGNHDLSYEYGEFESGYSYLARYTVVEGTRMIRAALPEDHVKVMHYLGGVLFSHAGLTMDFAEVYELSSDPAEAAEAVNEMGKKKLWQDVSPIWARPQYGYHKTWPEGILQVVGHTPVDAPFMKNGFLTLDTFSTYKDGTPIGTCEFIYLDTEKGKYEGVR